MPTVNNKRYSYGPKGLAAAKKESARTSMPMEHGKSFAATKKPAVMPPMRGMEMAKKKTVGRGKAPANFGRGRK